MWVVRIALQRPYTFLVLALLLLIIGPLTIIRTPVDIFPNIDIPIVSVVWGYTGLPPASGRALHQAELRYTGGLVTYLEVATQQNNALQAQLSAADITARRMTASIALVKALGGGWKEATDLENPSKN